MKNLDAQINEVGYEIAKILHENQINKILGVLSSDGVYAMWVYCKSQKYCQSQKELKEKDWFQKLSNLINFKTSSYEREFQKLSQNLHKLLFTKEIIERTLIYARYHAKSVN